MSLFSFNLNSVNQRELEQGSQILLASKTQETKPRFPVILEKTRASLESSLLFLFNLSLFLLFLQAEHMRIKLSVLFTFLFDSYIAMSAKVSCRD